jgi:integrase
VTLGPGVLGKLREHRERQEVRRRFAGDKWKEHDPVFPSTVGTPMEAPNLLRNFKRMLRVAELPDFRFHDLRHTAATLMLQQGVHPKAVRLQ